MWNERATAECFGSNSHTSKASDPGKKAWRWRKYR